MPAQNKAKQEEVKTNEDHYEQERQVINCIPEPYLILQGVANSERIVDIIDKDQVTLTITAYECVYTMSQPNGLVNLACPEKYANKDSTIARASDGSQLALPPAQPTTESKVSRNLQAAKDYDASMNSEAPVVKDDDEQWQMVNEDSLFGESTAAQSTVDTADQNDALGKGAPNTLSSV